MESVEKTRRQTLIDVLVYDYERKSDRAGAILSVINSASSTEEKFELMELVLVGFGLAFSDNEVKKEELPVVDIVISDEEFVEILRRRDGSLKTFVFSLIFSGLPSRKVAEEVLRYIDELCVGKEKIIVLSRIIYSPLVPYAVITREFFNDSDYTVPAEVFMRPQVLLSRSQLHRLVRSANVSMTTGIMMILERHSDLLERKAVLQQLQLSLVGLGESQARVAFEEQMRASAAEMEGKIRQLMLSKDPLKALKEACRDPNCPVHSKAATASDEDGSDGKSEKTGEQKHKFVN